ncbi:MULTISPECIES: DUF6429 family protein [Pseudomonas]|uniref:DUF6429 family protein n=1 Tax=Pseudomonas TaxID=286 RepID=UPI0018E37D39|nr:MULTISPECIES: DUF6429 family protein [Pseudomonas]
MVNVSKPPGGGNVIWLKRFAKHPTNHLALEPVRQLSDSNRLDQLLCSNIRELAWKGFDFETMSRLHEHGFISNPVNKNKSIWLTAEGLE